MANEIAIISESDLKSKIYVIRGVQVMLDIDLAEIYGYETKRFNEQVKNNIERFDDDFRFQLTDTEVKDLRSKFSTANISLMSRSLPYAFTEQGIYMLMTVLRGDLAVAQSKMLIRMFKAMKSYIQENSSLLPVEEIKLLKQSVLSLTERQNKTDKDIQKIYESIDRINENFVQHTDLKEFVIYKGQKFEADVAYTDIYKLAKSSIYIIDDYVNIKTLNLLKQKKKNVEVIIFTENKRGINGVLTSSEITDFNSQYPSLKIKPNPDCHDRFIIVDYKTQKEAVFHCGASSKDAGNKICTINKIENTSLVYQFVDAYLLQNDKVI
ncbi:ORF6N domain-containing protein [uncultured Treponema sp.]|uniref:ORF6N domain-containing protein n=1 Tax=uncultured Treponema sp. TaxID=162155 RepID=UPI002585DD03|nr:ORF6N domain-containing protein [uncultured Treponema sp.]